MKASCTPCEKSSTVSLSGQRVATMRARRSSSSASGVSIVNGRTAVLSAGVSSVTAMWVLLGGDGGLVTSRTLTVSSARRVRRKRWVCSLGSPWAAPWSRSLIAGDNVGADPRGRRRLFRLDWSEDGWVVEMASSAVLEVSSDEHVGGEADDEHNECHADQHSGEHPRRPVGAG